MREKRKRKKRWGCNGGKTRRDGKRRLQGEEVFGKTRKNRWTQRSRLRGEKKRESRERIDKKLHKHLNLKKKRKIKEKEGGGSSWGVERVSKSIGEVPKSNALKRLRRLKKEDISKNWESLREKLEKGELLTHNTLVVRI